VVAANQHHLARSRAGMRLIAQMRLYNDAAFERLGQYIADYYAETVLGESSAAERLAALHYIYHTSGRLKVAQVVGAGEYQVIVALLAEQNADVYLANLAVDEEHPHKVVLYTLEKMDRVEE
jgi:hypothetical protein